MTTNEFKAECNRRRAEGLVLSGNTYPIKDQIKAAGGIWDALQRAWLVPSREVLAALDAAARQAPRQPFAGNGNGRRNYGGGSRRGRWQPCGYPGCSPNYCDECDGEGYRPGH